MLNRLAIVLLLVVSLGTLGCGESGVGLEGQVTVDGKAVDSGMLSFVNTGEGGRYFALLNGEGKYSARSEAGPGVEPGSYSVTFRRDVTQAMMDKLPASVQKKMTGDTMTITYRSPDGFTVDVPEAGSQDVLIEIDRKKGWTLMLSD